MDKIVSPNPRLRGVVPGRRQRHRRFREEGMGRSRVHKVAISFIYDEGNVIRLDAVGKSSDKGGRVYSTRLVNSILSYSTRIYYQKRLTGLFGVTRAIALVLAVMRVAASSGDGRKPFCAVVTNGTVFIPSIFKVILWAFVR